jgi:hypothetical protein
VFSESNKKLNEEKKVAIEGKYRKVTLGMTRKEVLDILRSDSYLEIDESTDYGDFDEEQNYLLKVKRPPFIEHIYYQFTQADIGLHDRAKPGIKKNDLWILYAIIIKFSLKHNSYYSLYNKILSKYGEADLRTSKFSVWNTKGRSLFKAKSGEIPVRLILNYPTTIKIIDEKTYLRIFIGRKKNSQDGIRSYQQELNDKLLDDFSSK